MFSHGPPHLMLHSTIFIPIEQIAHVGILGVNVPIIKIYLAQFDYNNKITDKALLKL
jgi:hypothetical protein